MLSKTNLPLEILQFACLKIDQAQRHQYWMFDVGRSMFDVLLPLDQVFSVIHCSGQAEPHTRNTLYVAYKNQTLEY